MAGRDRRKAKKNGHQKNRKFQGNVAQRGGGEYLTPGLEYVIGKGLQGKERSRGGEGRGTNKKFNGTGKRGQLRVQQPGGGH